MIILFTFVSPIYAQRVINRTQANSAGPDQTPLIAASDQGRHFLHKTLENKNEITIHPSFDKWTHPFDKDGRVHWV